MRVKVLGAFALCLFLLAGCASAPHIIGYELLPETSPRINLGRITISSFSDERPAPEREGIQGRFLTFSSRDAHFSQEVAQAIKELLAQELHNAGFSLVEEKENPDFIISGKVLHFQAIMAPAKITFLPYLGTVSTLWAKDEFKIALSIYIQMYERNKNILIDRAFTISQDMQLPTGLLSLARYRRGFNYKLRLLDEALKDVLGQIRQEVVVKAKEMR